MEEDIIHSIKRGGQTELGMVYEEYRSEFIHWLAKTYGCSSDDCKDIYQLVILTFYNNIKQDKLSHLTSSVKTYLFGIGKNIAMETLRKNSKLQSIDQEEWIMTNLVDEETDPDEIEGKFTAVKSALVKLGHPCRKVIELFYHDSKSMEEIASVLSYKNAETVKNQKYKCMKRLRVIFTDELDNLTLRMTS